MNEIIHFIGQPLLAGIVQMLILLPLGAGLLLFLVPDKFRLAKGLLAVAVSMVTLGLALGLMNSGNQLIRQAEAGSVCGFIFPAINVSPAILKYLTFNIDSLARLITLFISLFATLIVLYSLVYIRRETGVNHYFEYFLITLGASFGAVMSDNLLLFLFFWGILGITLYKLIRGRDEGSSATAEKTLIIIGASDGIMILGIAIIWMLTRTLDMSAINLETNSALPVVACIALLIGSFTKAGAFPFHSWIPDYAKYAPASSSAYLPASLDKLLGIYFLARITGDLFVMNQWLTLTLLSIGVITIITAVMMAMIQHNYKRLLGYHAVSQVGYMVLGFGLGSLAGIAAGLFHMVNHALYKSGLMLTAGCVEYRTGKETIDELGGLSKVMPVTYVVALVFALSISGIPPFNGFASKWMIYQAIVDFGAGPGIANKLWILWLGLAVLGSALTLASFIKFIGGIFLSRQKAEFSGIKEVPFLMWMPMVILALLCIGFGVFATNYVVPQLFMPVTGNFAFSGTWNSSFVALLILASIVLGFLIYLAGNIRNFRSEDSYIGGEKMQETASFATPEFYKTIGEFTFFSWIYQKAEDKWFDLYDLVKKAVLWLNRIFSNAHTGVLHDYALWVFIGLIIMLIILI